MFAIFTFIQETSGKRNGGNQGYAVVTSARGRRVAVRVAGVAVRVAGIAVRVVAVQWFNLRIYGTRLTRKWQRLRLFSCEKRLFALSHDF